MGTEYCVACNRTFAEVQASDEHVIPNALGGLLTTKHATCVKCNSDSGHAEDSALIELFKPLLAGLDVVRSRGDAQSVLFDDPNSRNQFLLQPGRQPVKAPNFRAERTENGVRFHVSAPTREEALSLIKRYAKQDPYKIDLTPVSESREKYTWGFKTVLHDPVLLRAVVRMAIYFAREKGAQIGSDAPAIEFLRGRREAKGVVAPVRGDVVEVRTPTERTLTHGLFLRCFPGESQCFVHVVLFEYLEFIVWLGSLAEPVPLAGHQVNLISGRKIVPEFAWHASPVVMGKWLRNPKMNGDRLVARFDSVKYYLENQNLLWMERAILRASEAYFAAIDGGRTIAEAHLEAKEAGDKILLRHDLKIDEIDFAIAENGQF